MYIRHPHPHTHTHNYTYISRTRARTHARTHARAHARTRALSLSLSHTHLALGWMICCSLPTCNEKQYNGVVAMSTSPCKQYRHVCVCV